MTNLLSFERFERIIKTIQEFDKKQERVTDFLEKELMEGSFCSWTFGSEVAETLIKVLADEYDCWHSTPQASLEFREGQFIMVPSKNRNKLWYEAEGVYYADNDISWWLYDCQDKQKIVEVDGLEYDVTNLRDFHEFLIQQMEK